MTEENANAGAVTLDENGFIPGTSYKSVDDLIKGHTSLKEMSDRQANELGETKKGYAGLQSQAETLANLLKENLTKSDKATKAEPADDYGKQIAAVKTELKALDPVSEDFVSKQADLVDRLAHLAAAAQHEKTLGAAGKLFKDELSERDVKAAQQRFYDENPTFNTPDMQAKIKEYIAKDKTGMSDPLSAFYQIQRDETAALAKQNADENAELKKRLNLAKGTDETGKVIVKGQSPGQSKTNQTKVTGKDLDAGMMERLKALNSA
jgi:hypothetical protein